MSNKAQEIRLKLYGCVMRSEEHSVGRGRRERSYQREESLRNWLDIVRWHHREGQSGEGEMYDHVTPMRVLFPNLSVPLTLNFVVSVPFAVS